MMRSPGAPVIAVACGVLLGLLLTGAGHGSRGSPEIVAALRYTGAVALVGCACAMVMLAVRAVSDRRVTRVSHHCEDEPALPGWRPEPEPEDVWTTIPPSRRASPVAPPGHVARPAPDPAPAPAPGREEVPR
jgi:hypothetical protein